MERAVRLDVQGLRAVAVLAVVLDHAAVPLFGGGYVGVDVFLVLSGFLITGLMVREADASGRVSVAGFYARRARRILPAAAVVLVAVLLVTALGLGYVRQEQVSSDVRWSAAFLANWHFADLGTDYFAEGLPPSPVQHYWSLAVEEQFYLVWPPLLVALLWLARRLRLPRWPVVATVVAVLCGASLAWSVAQTGSDPTTAYFSSLTRAWELGIGALLALAAPLLARLGTSVRHLLAVTGLAAIALAVLAYDAATPFPGHHALLPVLGTAALLAAGTGAAAVGVARVLTIRPLTWVGDLSYSLYLWHWPVLVLAADLRGPDPGALETAVLLLVALALSVASYHLVENPVRRHRWFAVRLHSLALWPAAIALVAVAAVGAHVLAEERLSGELHRNRDYLALRDAGLPVAAQLRDSLRRADAGEPVAFPLTSTDQLTELAKDRWHRLYTCYAGKDETSTEICPVGDVAATRTVAVVGDSHAGQWLPALDDLARRAGYRLVPLVKLGCTPYDAAVTERGEVVDYAECTDFRSWTAAQLATLRPDVVLVAGRAMQETMLAAPEDRPAAWTRAVRSTLTRLQGLAPDVRVLSDVSSLEVEPLDCLADPAATMATCTNAEKPWTVEGNRITAEVAAELRVPYVDLTPLACLDGRCPAVAGGLMVYTDHTHLSPTWVRHVEPEVARRLGPLQPG